MDRFFCFDAGFGRYIPEMAEGRALTPPYILKKRIGIWGKDCFIISNPVDEQRQLDRITDPEYFCQKFIAGPTEFCTHILFVNGRIVKALNIKYEFASSAPIKGQDAGIDPRSYLQIRILCPSPNCRRTAGGAGALPIGPFEGDRWRLRRTRPPHHAPRPPRRRLSSNGVQGDQAPKSASAFLFRLWNACANF